MAESHKLHYEKYTNSFFAFIFILSYILFFFSRTKVTNLFWPFNEIAIYAIIPVLGGIYLNRYYGFFVGLLSASIIAGIYQSQNVYIFILPMAITGFLAGIINNKLNYFYASFTIIIGQMLIYLSYYLLEIKFLPTFSYYALAYDLFIKLTTLLLINNILIYIIGIEE